LPTVFPGAPEVCNNIDDNCNGVVDDEGAQNCITYYYDHDGDGYGVASNWKCYCAPTGKYSALQAGDCNDSDYSVYPGQIETCNGRDDNCDGITDPPGSSGCQTYYLDVDGDGFGVSGNTRCQCGPSGDYKASTPGDCNDGDRSTYPGAPELCGDGRDNNCDGRTDEEGCSGCTNYYRDEDGDSYGIEDFKCLSAPQGTYRATRKGDCNDSDSQINPGAQEVCDGKDNNCNNSVDEENAQGCITYYYDFDVDGYGVAANSKCLCSMSGKYTATVAGDCNDNDSSIKPGATEVCNSKDDDCDGQTDEEGALNCTWKYLDNDGDGYGVTSDRKCLCAAVGKYTADIGGDCNDSNPDARPGATEVCGNGVDDNCDGRTDEEGCGGCTNYYRDDDQDTYGVTNDKRCLSGPQSPYTATRGGDCNDSDATVNPGVIEACNNKDDNCNGATDEPGSTGCSTFYLDKDTDTYGVSSDSQCLCAPTGQYTATRAGDCDDNDALVHPGAVERCNNNKDDDCDGVIDNEGCQGCITYYYDGDSDGYGVNGNSKCLTSPSGKYSALVAGDCNDSDPLVKPGATEICNSKDDNCDGLTDPENTQGCTQWYYDVDGDGWGVMQSKCLCAPSGLYRAQNAGDCNDTNAQVYPGAPETCNSLDDDCDMQVDEEGAQGCTNYYLDGDNDRYGRTGSQRCLCQPQGLYSVVVGGDCDDSNPAINPAAAERCNGVDDNCNGVVDDGDPVAMCGNVQNGRPVCTNGVCGAVCDGGYYDVNHNLMDGCECQQDQYDTSGNTCAQAVDLGTLSDAGSGSTRSISGRIVPDSDQDWYKVRVVDTQDTGDLSNPGRDRFNVRVRLTNPVDGSIRLNVYWGSCSTQITCLSGSFNSVETQWAVNFSDQTNNLGENPCIGPVTSPGQAPILWYCCKSGECDECRNNNCPDYGKQPAECCGGKNNNNVDCTSPEKDLRHCADETTTIYIRVFRNSGQASNCGQTDYALDIGVGL